MPTEAEVTALADAMWQLLDDMGEKGQTVCLAAKVRARLAFEPWNTEEGALCDMPLEEAKRLWAEYDR